MVELEFNCCMCGEENKQCHPLLNEYNEEIVTAECSYCGSFLTLNIEIEYKVKSVDEQ